MACGTATFGRVEAEHLWARLRVFRAAAATFEGAAESEVLLGLVCALEADFTALPVGDVHCVCDPLADIRCDREPVDQNEDRLVEIDIQEGLRRGEFEDPAALEQAVIPAPAQLREPTCQERLGCRARAAGVSHGVVHPDRKQRVPTAAGFLRQKLSRDQLYAVLGDPFSAARAVCAARAREQQSQKVG